MSVSGTYLPLNLPNLPMASGRASPTAVVSLALSTAFAGGIAATTGPLRSATAMWDGRDVAARGVGGLATKEVAIREWELKSATTAWDGRDAAAAALALAAARGVGGLATKKIAIGEWELNKDGVVWVCGLTASGYTFR
jgi:hypothetical protein